MEEHSRQFRLMTRRVQKPPPGRLLSPGANVLHHSGNSAQLALALGFKQLLARYKVHKLAAPVGEHAPLAGLQLAGDVGGNGKFHFLAAGDEYAAILTLAVGQNPLHSGHQAHFPLIRFPLAGPCTQQRECSTRRQQARYDQHPLHGIPSSMSIFIHPPGRWL